MGRPRNTERLNKAATEARRQRWQDSIDASQIMNTLVNHGSGKLKRKLEPTQIKAYEIVLSRLVPTLSAQELTTIEPDQAKSEQELIQEAIDLLKGHPELLRQAGYVPIVQQVAPQQAQSTVRPDTEAA
jgi:hypothetical protein